ncbi:hypothetical protein E0H75_22280 [Kribbella capetownensis]|uniref:Uncharacterized protein n=1 Tax=Kribbella capetownensis TaxID=1572659 RepID=A0A4R0JR73_9ACTN|nr:hypothetical protein [Kribbella capetownensis]TCC47508.1 hypothetical protein E0H75_22280 [Kribbella capetownensis]
MSNPNPEPLAEPLSDQFPILLAPLRLETKWTATELLVRAFPDEWAVDVFEPLPTRQEVDAAQRHLIARWLAGHNRGEQLAAWRNLVASTGPGRAAWLMANFPAHNPDDEPRKIRTQRILVVASEEPYPQADRSPATTFWTAVWLAARDSAAVEVARAALVAAVGSARAEAVQARRPAGLGEPAPEVADDVIVAFLRLPSSDVDTRPASWNQAGRARLLPDQLVLLGFRAGAKVVEQSGAALPESLAVTLDPSLPDDEQLRVDADGQLRIPDELRWLLDFDRAVEIGLGFRVPITDQLRAGLERLVVVGVRTGSTPQDTRRQLEGLLLNHFHSSTGLRVVPQGTPTNNTSEASSGGEALDPAVESFDAFFRPHPNVPIELWQRKAADRWLAELLGLDRRTFFPVPGSGTTDQSEVRAMNVALWPATWGYHLKTTLWPIFSGERGRAQVDAIRDFFVRYVSGCGAIPSIQIGRQPYGILPTTAFSRLVWPDEPAEQASSRRGLYRLLGILRDDWEGFAAQVARVGSGGDPHRTLLDILGLHPASVEFDQRYLHSVNDYYNRLYLGGVGPLVLARLREIGFGNVADLLARLGHDAPSDVGLRLITGRHHRLGGPLVDVGPLSETQPVRPSTDDGRNYLRWLADEARVSLEPIRRQDGFTNDRPPRALLYLLSRHAVMLSSHDSALRMRTRATGVDHLTSGHREQPFVHVTEDAAESESRFLTLYSAAPEVTGDPDALLVDHLPTVLGADPDIAELGEQIDAIERLADVPTANLERALVQHLDCCSYRLDAWWLGLAHERLVEQRYRPDFSDYRRGLHLGAYGVLEDVRPRADVPQEVALTGELAEVFTPPGAPPLFAAPDSDGFLHAPSLNQAATAAILRAGYLANASTENPGSLAVDLSSARVRIARSFLEGINSGQSLGALLGYQFERGLHDRYGLAVGVDRFVSALRRVFPLRARRLPSATPPAGTPIEALEARNVVDGLALVRHVTRTGEHRFPFGREIPMDPPPTAVQLAAVNAEVERLLQINDALADLAIAEGVHQVVLGNMDRAAATLNAFAKGGATGGSLPEPAVVESPNSGTGVTHRVAVHLPAGLDPNESPVAGMAMTPRAQADPGINAWLAGLLPPPGSVGCLVSWTDPVTGAARERVVTQAEIGLQPIDLLWIVRPEDPASMAELDDRIIGRLLRSEELRPDVAFSLQYTERVPGGISFFELSALIGHLRQLIVAARPVRPSDLVPPAAVDPVDPAVDEAIDLGRRRPVEVRQRVRDLQGALQAYLADAAAGDLPVDELLARLGDLLAAAGAIGLSRGGWTELAGQRRAIVTDVLAAVAEVVARMSDALTRADARLAEYDVLPPETPSEQRFRLLARIERFLNPEPTAPRPATPEELRAAVVARRARFAERLSDVAAVESLPVATLSGLVEAVREVGPLAGFDAVGLELDSHEARAAAFVGEMVAQATAVELEVAERLRLADDALTAFDAASNGPGRVAAAQNAIHAVLGDDAVATAEFAVPDAMAAEWERVVAAAEAEQLTGHLERDFPIDDWLHGVARVRERMRLWEQVTLLGGAVGSSEPGLLPAQFPYVEGDPWLGLELPADVELADSYVLYTAHYPDRIRPSGTVCAILVDEWTEVIPTPTETTGLAVNVDRPGTQPPQTMLLVTPPQRTGTWVWDDIVAAVNETFDLARLRLVEPAHLEDTPYVHLLPATGMTATRHPITISTDLAANNIRNQNA